MKKVFSIVTIFVILTACGSSKSGKQIAEEVCDCSKKANAIAASDPNRVTAQTDCAKKQVTAWNKVKDNQKKADEFNKALGICAEEQIKKSFGQ